MRSINLPEDDILHIEFMRQELFVTIIPLFLLCEPSLGKCVSKNSEESHEDEDKEGESPSVESHIPGSKKRCVEMNEYV